ncbi:hypothetical protein [Blautia hansenii]|uniref:hypothetical protein n=1 Tax=Blautia hansenii TaxID=1322 RepID=UPI003983F655
MERYVVVARENQKHNLWIPFLICILLLIVSPLFLGIENLTEPETAKVLEYYAVFISIILLPAVFLPEQDKDIRDLLSSKYMPMAKLYGIRMTQAIIYLMLLLGIYMCVLKAGNCEFAFLKLYMGELATMVFLGGMGIFFYALTDQVVVGYMIPLLYYMLNITISPNKIKAFYLFSMSIGKYEWKWTLGIAGVVLFVAGIAIRSKRK